MKENATVIILIVLVILLISLFIIGLNYSFNKQSLTRNKICESIANNLGLEFLESANGRCGSGEACDFQCRLLNPNGEVIVKNYP